ncbi:MAG TPA: hypothetical protein VK787_03640 [Puia sp.]|jgi:hypothetical protein|nr:hypothetical protein [Puia sp.]
MTAKNLFIFAGVCLLLFGVPLIISPETMAKTFLIDPTISSGAAATFRGYGIFLTAVAIGQISAMNAGHSKARRGILITIALASVFILINTIYEIVTEVGNAKCWSIVVLDAITGLWSIMLLPKEKTSEA